MQTILLECHECAGDPEIDGSPRYACATCKGIGYTHDSRFVECLFWVFGWNIAVITQNDSILRQYARTRLTIAILRLKTYLLGRR